MNGIFVVLMLGLVASTVAYPYPSKQLRIRQVVVPPAGSVAEPEVPEPPSRFPPFDFGRKVKAPEGEDPAEIVEVPDLDEPKAEEIEEKVKEPFIIKPESNSDDEMVQVEGADDEKKEEEELKEEEEHEEEEKEKEKEEKEEHVEAPKEEKPEANDGDKEEKEEKDSSSSSEEKSGENEAKADVEKEAGDRIDPLLQAAYYGEESHGKAVLVPKAASKPAPACGANDKQLKQRVEAIIAELHEIKELCCKLEEIQSKEEEAQ